MYKYTLSLIDRFLGCFKKKKPRLRGKTKDITFYDDDWLEESIYLISKENYETHTWHNQRCAICGLFYWSAGRNNLMTFHNLSCEEMQIKDIIE